MKQLLFCSTCSQYTMKEVHTCGHEALPRTPAKWSPEDKYGKYRLQARMKELEQKGFTKGI